MVSYEKGFFENDFKLFPDFTMPKLSTTYGNNGYEPLSLYSTPSNDVIPIIPLKLGIAAYNEQGEKVDEWFANRFYQKEDEWEDTWMNFPLIRCERGKKYTFRPSIKMWGSKYLQVKASPENTFVVPLKLSSSKEQLTLKVGDTATFDILDGWGDYLVTTSDKQTATAIQSSDNPREVTVTGKKLGTAQIEVLDRRSQEKAVVAVNVVTAVVLTLSAKAVNIEAGSTATVEIISGSGDYGLSVVGEDYVTASLSGNVITVQGLKVGTAYITVRDNVTGQTASVSVIVTKEQPPVAFDGQITMERKYLVNRANEYCYQEADLRMDNGMQLQIRYHHADYWQGTYEKEHKGIYIAVGPCEDVNADWWLEANDWNEEWYIGPVVIDEWVNEKIVVANDGTVQYYMNDEYIGSHQFEMLRLDNAQNLTLDFQPYGWWTGHHHYMDDLRLTLPNRTITDNFNDGVIDTNIWQTPDNPEGVREEDGILKMEQIKTDWPYHLRSNPIPLIGLPIDKPDVSPGEAIDLGLPSGTLWASCNVGATAPEEYGDYFAWGETEPKEVYDWSTYKWCNGRNDSMTKYCTNSSYGTVDNKTELDPEDDAATANWGGDWRMPTLEQIKELYNNTAHESYTLNGVSGRRFTGTNGNSIFLPFAGYRWDLGLYDAGSDGGYWSSTLSGFWGQCYASGLEVDSSDAYLVSGYRGYGKSVRPVRQN